MKTSLKLTFFDPVLGRQPNKTHQKIDFAWSSSLCNKIAQHIKCKNHTFRVKIQCLKIPFCVWKSHSACRNHPRDFYSVKITLMRVEITLVLVEITLVCVNFTLWVWKSYFPCKNHSLHVKITFCISESHSSCKNQTGACKNHTCVCRFHARLCWNHTRASVPKAERVLASIYLRLPTH
jgi:hypothetical protein